MDALNQILKSTLQKVETDPQHHLPYADRLTIYRGLGPSKLTPEIAVPADKQNLFPRLTREYHRYEFLNFRTGDYLLGWLALVTARKVKVDISTKLIEEDWLTPQQVLEAAESILRGSVPVDKAMDLAQEFASGIGIEDEVTYDVSCSYAAANAALQVIVDGSRDYLHFRVNDDHVIYSRDFASYAVKAYTANDTNPPGLVGLYYGIDTNVEEHPQITESTTLFSGVHGDYVPVTFDKEKRLEFWRWWLNEAVLQAIEIGTELIEASGGRLPYQLEPK